MVVGRTSGVALLIVLATACGGGGSSPPTAGPASTASTAPTSPTSPTVTKPLQTSVPDVLVRDVATGADVNLRALGLPDRPTLYWFWAPH
jgi:hypothetical protein